MPDLPVMLRVDGKRCVVIGGGGVATRRARSLKQAGADVVVVAPEISSELSEIAFETKLKEYEPNDLDSAFLVVIATDNPAVNQAASEFAKSKNILINRADAPTAGDLSIPAHKHHGPITLAVYTGGNSASAAAAIRRELSKSLDPAWPKLLEIAGFYRGRILAGRYTPTERRNLLLRLTSLDAVTMYRDDGIDVYVQYCENLLTGG